MAFTSGNPKPKSTFVAITSGTLAIRGTTNINSFACHFDVGNINNPVRVNYYAEGDRIKFDQTALVLSVDCFDCGGRGINSDFQELLKAEEEPHIYLTLKEISPLKNSTAYKALLDIEIAGKSNRCEVPVAVEKDHSLLVKGDLKLCLSDYKLEAPKKLFGLINIDDNVEIGFQLALREVDN